MENRLANGLVIYLIVPNNLKSRYAINLIDTGFNLDIMTILHLPYIWLALKVPSVLLLGLNTCSTLGNDILKVSRRTSSTVSTAKIVN
jgi:hypothetical protein